MFPDAESFISDSFSDLLNSEDAIAHLINTPSVDEEKKSDPQAIANKFGYLLQNLMPYIRDRLSHNFIKQTLSETLELEPEIVGLLVEKILFSSYQDEDGERDFAIADIFNLRAIS